MSQPQPAPPGPGSSSSEEVPKSPTTPAAAVLVDHLERGELDPPYQPRAAEPSTLSSWIRQLRAPPPSPSSEYAVDVHAAPAVDSTTLDWSRPSSDWGSFVIEDDTPTQEMMDAKRKKENTICAFFAVTMSLGMVFFMLAMSFRLYGGSGDSVTSNSTANSTDVYYPIAFRNA
ncbi:hypothetical protein BP6252_09012 [Coleophoma cylindrospora]|uniref:Uncharacterized protein n=1 Tax=Coleophoma cylindrospora TaxID=1849047 RepID=A0A3D8R0R0_9HELO|nr:hypothetical protein BP6252_09012 [Coleophoma cylindrospora]